jgi:hypothetical protein
MIGDLLINEKKKKEDPLNIISKSMDIKFKKRESFRFPNSLFT